MHHCRKNLYEAKIKLAGMAKQSLLLSFLTYFLQDLKDYMKKAGEITYSTVNRENSGEGYVDPVLRVIELIICRLSYCTDCIFVLLFFLLYFYVTGTNRA